MGNRQPFYDEPSDDFYSDDSSEDDSEPIYHDFISEPKKFKLDEAKEFEIDAPPDGTNPLLPFLSIETVRLYSSQMMFEEAYNLVVASQPPASTVVTLDDGVLTMTSRSDHAANTTITTITLRKNFSDEIAGIKKAACSCSLSTPLWCRHIVSALLFVIYRSDSVIRVDIVSKALSQIDRVVLQDILLQHCKDHPEFAVQLTKSMKETLPSLFEFVPAIAASSSSSSAASTGPASTLEQEVAGQNPEDSAAKPAKKKITLKPLLKSDKLTTADLSASPADAASSAAPAIVSQQRAEPRPTDWRPACLLQADSLISKAETMPELDTSRFANYLRDFLHRHGMSSTYSATTSTCPMYCHLWSAGLACPHVSTDRNTKVSQAPAINELMDNIDLLWQYGDMKNAIDAMIRMTEVLSHQLVRAFAEHGSRAVGYYQVAERIGERWCRLILSCPELLLKDLDVAPTLKEFLDIQPTGSSGYCFQVFQAALTCCEHHWSHSPLVRLLDEAFGIQTPVALPSTAAAASAEATDAMDVDEPALDSTSAKKRKRGGAPKKSSKKSSTKSSAASNAESTSTATTVDPFAEVYDEPLPVVSARLQFFVSELPNRVAWNALARWVIAGIDNVKRGTPSIHDSKMIADALVAHSALGALAFLARPIKLSLSHSKKGEISIYMNTGELTEICNLLVMVAGKCCSPELKARRAELLPSLVVRCATLVAPHLWESLEDAEQVMSLLDYPPEITDLVTLELAIQALGSLSARCERSIVTTQTCAIHGTHTSRSNSNFSSATMVWSLLPKILAACDAQAAFDTAIVVFPNALFDSTESSSSATLPAEVREKGSVKAWNQSCCRILLDLAYTRMTTPTKKKQALFRAVEAILSSSKLSMDELRDTFALLVEWHEKQSLATVSLDAQLDAPRETVIPEPEEEEKPKTPAKKAGRTKKGAASKQAAVEVEVPSFVGDPVEMVLQDLIWRVGKRALTRPSAYQDRNASYYSYQTPPDTQAIKLKVFEQLLSWAKKLPQISHLRKNASKSVIPVEEKDMLHDIATLLLDPKLSCDDTFEVLQAIASRMPPEDATTIRVAAKSFEVAAASSNKKNGGNRYNYGGYNQPDDARARETQQKALDWLKRAAKLSPKDRDAELITSLINATFSMVPTVDFFDSVQKLCLSPGAFERVGLTEENVRSIRTKLIDTVSAALTASNPLSKSERAVTVCIHLGLLPSSLLPERPANDYRYDSAPSDLVPLLPRMIEYISDKKKNMYWFDLMIEQLKQRSEGTGHFDRLNRAAKTLSENGRWDLAVKLQGDAVLQFARHLTSNPSEYTKLVNQLVDLKTVCVDAGAADIFEEVHSQVVSLPNVIRKPKLMQMLQASVAILTVAQKGATNAKAKAALEKTVNKAKAQVLKGENSKECGSCLFKLSNPTGSPTVICPKCSHTNVMLVDDK